MGYISRPAAFGLRRPAGYAVRDETVLKGGGSTVTLMISEGEKVASGETLAVSYQGTDALARASEIRALQLRISAAEAGMCMRKPLRSSTISNRTLSAIMSR
jgi:hypothetical protein